MALPEQVAGRRAAVVDARSRRVHHSPSGRPQAPAQIDVLEVGEVVLVEAADLLEQRRATPACCRPTGTGARRRPRAGARDRARGRSRAGSRGRRRSSRRGRSRAAGPPSRARDPTPRRRRRARPRVPPTSSRSQPGATRVSLLRNATASPRASSTRRRLPAAKPRLFALSISRARGQVERTQSAVPSEEPLSRTSSSQSTPGGSSASIDGRSASRCARPFQLKTAIETSRGRLRSTSDRRRTGRAAVGAQRAEPPLDPELPVVGGNRRLGAEREGRARGIGGRRAAEALERLEHARPGERPRAWRARSRRARAPPAATRGSRAACARGRRHRHAAPPSLLRSRAAMRATVPPSLVTTGQPAAIASRNRVRSESRVSIPSACVETSSETSRSRSKRRSNGAQSNSSMRPLQAGPRSAAQRSTRASSACGVEPALGLRAKSRRQRRSSSESSASSRVHGSYHS